MGFGLNYQRFADYQDKVPTTKIKSSIIIITISWRRFIANKCWSVSLVRLWFKIWSWSGVEVKGERVIHRMPENTASK